MQKSKKSPLSKHLGMTLLEVLVGFVIFTSSLVAILNYVSNQIYLNHLTESNQIKAGLINDYAALSELGEDAQVGFASTLDGVGISMASSQIDNFKQGNKEMLLVQTLISVSDQTNTYEWSILELK